MKADQLGNGGDWDTLILLNGCRYDFFKAFHRHYPNLKKGRLERRSSAGETTTEALPTLFPESYPWNLLTVHEPTKYDRFYEATDWAYNSTFDTTIYAIGDDHTRITQPGTMFEYIFRLSDWLSDKQSVIRFSQPQQPFLGAVRFDINRFFPWEKFQQNGSISQDLQRLTRLAYAYNLLDVFYTLMMLLPRLDGTVVITADHGDDFLLGGSYAAIGDKRALREVPVLTVETQECDPMISKTDTEYIDTLYRSFLGRPVDDEGLVEKKELIQDNRSHLPLILLRSDEFRENQSSVMEVVEDSL